jgi:hypothetical protein
MRQDTEPEFVAHHEAGHAVAIVLAFRTAAWLPYPPPSVRVRSVEITEDTPGQWGGNCVGTNIYSTRWPIECIAEPYRDLMEAQIVIHLAGGIAEAVHRGERRRQEVLAFAASNCSIDGDLKQARAVLADLRRLTGCRYDEQRFAERALALLLAHWRAVEALAAALVEDHRIEGDQVEAIVDRACMTQAEILQALMSW